MSNTNTNTEEKSFNIITRASAFINDIRVIDKHKGKPFCALKVSLQDGVGDNVESKFCDLIVSGKQAKRVINHLEDAWPVLKGEDNHKWFAALDIGSIDTKTWTDKEGKTHAKLCGRLLKFNYLSIDSTPIQLEQYEAQTEVKETNPDTKPEPRAKFVPKAYVEVQEEIPDPQQVVVQEAVPNPQQVEVIVA